jgi:energy-coupling factor transporter ATP-binding protein EcfA2
MGGPAQRWIDELLRDETLDPGPRLICGGARPATLLAVISGPSGVGKTTLLTALLDFLPARTRRIYPRGCFETFAFLSDPAFPAETALLINEISPHLPVYLWGPAVARMLESAHRGYTVLATAHADTVQEFVGVLTGSPLRLPTSLVAAFEFVVVMEHSAQTRSGRHVRGVWRLERTTSGVVLEELSAIPGEPPNEDSRSDPRPEAWFPIHELRQRQHLLLEFRERHIERLPMGPSTGSHGPGPRPP